MQLQYKSLKTMYSPIIIISLLLVYNVSSQGCSFLPSSLPGPLKNLASPISTIPVSPYTCGCPEPSCVCGVIPPSVPQCGYNPAIGVQNPVLGVQTCGCPNAFGGCNCGSVIGNLCGCNTPTVGLASCGCGDPRVRVVDGCPRCQPVYSYNLPSIGYPTCGCTGYGGVIAPSYLPPCGCGGAPVVPCGCGCAGVCGCASPSCGCVGPCGCAAPSCACGCGSCGCVGPCGCAPVNACGCVEVPCGLPKVKTTCTCVTPTIETPYGCAKGKPTCACASSLEMPTCGLPVVPPFAPVIGCPRYLRQVCVQPPFL